jgi:tetratricopeptide (TPR) repeat protein
LRLEEEPPPLALAQKIISLLEPLLLSHEALRDDSLFLESAFCKLGTLYQLLHHHEKAMTLLQELIAQQRTAPSLAWKCATEASLLLAESYAAIGKTEEALLLFDAVQKEKAALRTPFGASACLSSARLRSAQWMQRQPVSADTRFYQILSQFKDLSLQKTLSNEPLHLEAALDYVDLQTQFEPDPLKKKLTLLTKTKEDFESATDLLSKDYHAARARLPHKNQIYQGYMRLMEAEILTIQATFSEKLDIRKELQAKAQDLLLQIVNEKAHSALVARARKRLENVSISAQKT